MRHRRCLINGAAAGALLLFTACSSAPTRTSTPAPADWTPSTTASPLADATSLTSPPGDGVSPAMPDVELPTHRADDDHQDAETLIPRGLPAAEPTASGRGLIAAAGPTGLRLLAPSGTLVGELGRGLIVTQPTWARDGSRLAATVVDPASGLSQVAVVDIATGNITAEATARPYFFYTWSHDGSRLVALGPGQTGGTAAAILDETGAPATDVTLQSQSMYVAWEPGGRRLLLHVGHRLLLLNDVDSPRDRRDYGPVGVDFLAPAWLPGTQDFLYVDSYGQAPEDATEQELTARRAAAGPQLLRRSADTGEITELGPAGPYTTMAVHPSGDSAAVSAAHELPAAGNDRDGPGGVPAGSVQIVDVATGERRTVLDQIGLWLEWSPDGRSLLVATSAGDPAGVGMSWHIWDGRQSYELTRFAPTATFLRDYVQFADQYDETPRLWSPDGDAITFGTSTPEGDVTVVAWLDRARAVASLGPSDVSSWSPLP